MAVVEAQETRVLAPVQQERALPVLRWIEASWFPWVWMGVWAVVHATDALVSWHFVVSGAALLRSPGHLAGLHLYATHPELQMGPLTFLVASPLSGAPEWASGLLAAVTIAAAGPLLLQAVTRLPQVTVTARQRGLAAAVLMPVWAELAVHYTHLDDALALALLVAALHAVSRERAATAALLLAASADAKPWTLAFVPVLLALPRERWQRAAWSWIAGIALAWLPFVIADPATLHVGRFSIPNVASSSLRPFGVTSPETPVWDRPAQVLLGVALGLVAVLRRRWVVVPALALAVRMILDPGTYPYYTSGLVLATVIVDLLWRRTRWPWLSIVVVAGLFVPRHLGPLTPSDAGLGVLRAITLLLVIAVTLGPDWRVPARRLTSWVGQAVGS
jgi:hypothetical protein